MNSAAVKRHDISVHVLVWCYNKYITPYLEANILFPILPSTSHAGNVRCCPETVCSGIKVGNCGHTMKKVQTHSNLPAFSSSLWVRTQGKWNYDIQTCLSHKHGLTVGVWGCLQRCPVHWSGCWLSGWTCWQQRCLEWSHVPPACPLPHHP